MTRKIYLRLLFILSLFILLNYSCGNSTDETSSEALAEENPGMRFGNENFQLPKLTAAAQDEVSNWSVFDDFQKEISTINGRTVDELKSKTERLILHTDSLSKKTPEILTTQPILARLIVVNSRVHLLQQEVSKGKRDSAGIANQLHELNLAAANFMIQINEKLQKDAIDLQRVDDEKKELEKQKRFLDSVYQAEREDMKNNNL